MKVRVGQLQNGKAASKIEATGEMAKGGDELVIKDMM